VDRDNDRNLTAGAALFSLRVGNRQGTDMDNERRLVYRARTLDGRQVIVALVGEDRVLFRITPDEPGVMDQEEYRRFAAGVVDIREHSIRGDWDA